MIMSVSIELVREQTSERVGILGIKEHRIRGVKKASCCVNIGASRGLISCLQERSIIKQTGTWQETGWSGCICQAQEIRRGLVISWLEEGRKNLFPSVIGTCSLPGTCRRSQSSFSPYWGARLWIQSSILWPHCISKGTSAGQVLLPPSHAEYGLFTDAEIQGCTFLPLSLRAEATVCSKPVQQTVRSVSLSLSSLLSLCSEVLGALQPLPCGG